MFSVDKIEGKLFDANDISMIQYNAGGLIPHLDRTNTVPFSERVQAFTIQPNPRRAGDGTVEDGEGWWWRWDFILFGLYDKEGYLTHVQFPINQGELEFSFRYIPTTVNSRTYKVNLGAEQYLQLFVNKFNLSKLDCLIK